MIEPMPSDIFQVGQILNNTYEIEGVLGRGGTGEVYRARNQIVGRVVAIKALNAQFSGKADYVELMKREEEMRNIISDSVVRYSECSRTDEGHVFLVMDFVDGPTLNNLMLSRPIGARDLMIIAHRMAEALVAVHGGGIVHRDLSPDNVILRGGNPAAAVLIDFGIAKDTATGARTVVGNEFAGKYEYSAPEQLDGRAEKRSDIYALGALLLASYRGEVPFLGATPGEIVRRKLVVLDTSGVPEPLKGLIDWMSAPNIDERPSSAKTLLDRIDRELKPVTQRRSVKTEGGKKAGGVGRILRPVAGVLLLAGIASAVWFSGLLGGFLQPPLPVASPYILSAEFNPAGARSLTANAPDAEVEAQLRAAYAAATGNDPEALSIMIATGMPSQNWPAQIQSALTRLEPLRRWQVEVSDTRITVTGLAPDIATRKAVAAALADWAVAANFDIETRLAAGPEQLLASDIQPALDSVRTCGPLEQAAGVAAQYGLSDTITITGNLMSVADAAGIEDILAPVIGDRKLRFETNALNNEICKIRNILPTVPTKNISIWLGNGATGAANLSGIYTVGENPIVEVQVPSTINSGSLSVMIVDTDGEVYHVLPNINYAEQALTSLGTVEAGVRRIRVLHSVETFRADQTLRAFLISEGDFGKSEVIAILSETPLFDLLRPGTESVESIAQALTAVLQSGQGKIIGVATRIIEARR